MGEPNLKYYDTAYPLERKILEFYQKKGKPLKILIINTGGTFTCLPDEEGKLEPIHEKGIIEDLVRNGLGFSDFINRGLLEYEILHFASIDSSQMKPAQRDELISQIKNVYRDYDGMYMFHGTDTGAESAKYFELGLPYYDVKAIWEAYITDSPWMRNLNWTKPLGVVSSQRSSVKRNQEGELMLRLGSDGPNNAATGLATIADEKLGGVFLTNDDTVVLGSMATKKQADIKPPYATDSRASDLVTYTIELLYPAAGYPHKHDQGETFDPHAITGASKFERKVLAVTEPVNLESLREFFAAKDQSLDDVVKFKRDYMPQVIIYEVRGEGHVLEDDDMRLMDRAKEEEGIEIFRVPIQGSRIPTTGHYKAPGFQYQALNMLSRTAIYKSMMTLALAEEMDISEKNSAKDDKYKNQRQEFIHTMMLNPWGNEFLPTTR